ncbi:MAG TPA: exodeoxyribonuclease VII small subunit [Candidatus Baltobacteraceae bacterium]|jgi:exodeoxyribonuclease VII small subunit|nr:exodeoxyribonuclease VII small subunit [Candidatus Baltobacteraceae bacterium]
MSNGVPKNFEEKLERIDAIVKELEGGRVELDRAIELFKEGKVLARECEVILRNAQDQVDRAMSDAPAP